jgi:uncharacterized protein YoaH (UPF0181 family)
MGMNLEVTKAGWLAELVRVRCKALFTRRVRKPNMHDRVFQLMARGLSSGEAIDAMQAERRTSIGLDSGRPQIEKDRE